MKKRGLKFNKTLILVLSLILVFEIIALSSNYNFKNTGNAVKKILGTDASNVKTPTATSAQTQPKLNGYVIQLKDDPVSQYSAKQSSNFNAKALSAKNYKQSLIEKQKIVEDEIKQISSKIKINSRYQSVFNGFVVADISEKDIAKIKSLPNVKEVYFDKEVQTFLYDSVPQIQADKVWNIQVNGTNLTGQGIKIGIIDTGVDYTQPELGSCFGAGCKVAGGYDFFNKDNDPMDDMGHGTHVAATAAGKGILNGVAPDATIYAYKALNKNGGGPLSNVIAAIEHSVDPNQDGDSSDHLDVISMSLGTWGDPSDPMSVASDNAVLAGVNVVVAVGNSGVPGGYFTIGSPGNAKDVIGVGADCKNMAMNSSKIEAYLIADTITSGYYYEGVALHWIKPTNILFDYQEVTNPENFMSVDDSYSLFNSYFVSKCPLGDVDWLGNGKYKMCSIQDNSKNRIFSSWAIVDLTNDSSSLTNITTLDLVASDYNVGCTPPYCENVSLELALFGTQKLNGSATKWIYLDTCIIPQDSNHVSCQISTLATSDSYTACNTPVASFSSIGPTSTGNAKPDVVAPGVSICAARYDSWLPEKVCLDDKHISISGTSMATPHVAGAVALIKQAHPSWTPQEIKNTLKGTATPFGLSPLIEGAGEINIYSAVNSPTPYPTASFETSNSLFLSGVVAIKGTAQSSNFDHYVLEYGAGLNPLSWTTITSVNAQKVNDVLGSIDLDQITTSVISIRLTVYDATGRYTRDLLVIFKRNINWKEGWPQKMTNDALYQTFSPVYADLDNDEKNEIIAGSPGNPDSSLYVRDNKGDNLPGWPQKTVAAGGTTPAVGDVDGDGVLDIVYSSTSLIGFGSESFLYAFKKNGLPINGWPKNLKYEFISDIYGYPVLEDINQDGKDEIIYTHNKVAPISIYKSDGSELEGGWQSVTARIPPSVGDIDNDGKPDIVVLAQNPYNQSQLQLFAWNGDGSIKQGFPMFIIQNNVGFTRVTLADLNKDGYREMVFVEETPAYAHMHVYNYLGNELTGWPIIVPRPDVGGYPIPMQLDNDLELEVALFAKRTLRSFFYDSDGSPIGNYTFSQTVEVGNTLISKLVYETENNTFLFVRSPESNKIAYKNLRTNEPEQSISIFEYPELSSMHINMPLQGDALLDIDNDGKLDILTTIFSYNMLLKEGSNFGTQVLAVDTGIPYSQTAKITSPMIGFNAKHTGCYDCGKTQINFLCGDVDGDGKVDISDLSVMVDYLYISFTPFKSPIKVADVDGSGSVDISDLSAMIDYLYVSFTPLHCNYPQTYSSSSTSVVSFGSATGTIIEKSVPINLNSPTDLSGVRLKISYDPKFVTLKGVASTPRTSSLSVTFSKDVIGIYKADGSAVIPKGEGAIINLKVGPGTNGFDTSSLKFTLTEGASYQKTKVTMQVQGTTTPPKITTIPKKTNIA
ncbi:MAG: S8 family serine peptidase [Nanoarchaeota archaeon]